MVIVSKGEEYSMLPMQEVPLDLSEFDIGGRQYRDYEAYLYSNRDLVKPGESLPINILLRDSDGRVVSSEERVDQLFLTVIDPEKMRYCSKHYYQRFLVIILIISKHQPIGKWVGIP